MLPVLNAVAPLAKILFSTIEKSVPDKDLQEKLKAQLQTQLMQSHTQELTAAAKIIEAEAKAGWFASSMETPFNVCINFYFNMELCIRTSDPIFFQSFYNYNSSR
jgi:hypothetical protein